MMHGQKNIKLQDNIYISFVSMMSNSQNGSVEFQKLTNNKNKLCTKLVLFTRLYRGARSKEHKI
jgi:hypothetical protein